MRVLASTGATLLREAPLFEDLADDELEEIAWAARPFSAEPGERLFQQGEAAEDLYLLADGRARVMVRVPGGGERVLVEVGRGEILGEMALIDGAPRSASAEAVEPTRGLRLSRHAFEVLRAARRPAARKLLRRVAVLGAARIRALNDGGHPGAGQESPAPRGVEPSLADGDERRIRAARAPALELDPAALPFLPLFREFTPPELHEILREMYCLSLPRGQTIFHEGDTAGSCFAVIRGAVQVSVERTGEVKKLALLGPGALFGELALLDATPRAATCATRERSLLLELPGSRFDALFESGSEAAMKFFDAAYRGVVESLRGANRRWLWLAARDVIARPRTQ